MKRVIKANTYQDTLEYIVDHYWEDAIDHSYNKLGEDASEDELASEASSLAIKWYIEDTGNDIYQDSFMSNIEDKVYDEYLYKIRSNRKAPWE